jgi:SnoaL-like polyketide cyclase
VHRQLGGRASACLRAVAAPPCTWRIVAPDYLNAEAEDDPDDVERRRQGPAGFLATSQWLRDAFADLRFELYEMVAEDSVVMAAATMAGEHTGTFQPPRTHRQAHPPQTGAHLQRRRRPDHPSPSRPRRLGLLLQLGYLARAERR